jgi:CxxC motif-containing protein (DUF1111 family)
MKMLRLVSGSVLVAALLVAEAAFAQIDPGVQLADRGTGAALSSVLANSNPGILDFFNDGKARFQAAEVVSNKTGVNVGLGPRFNSTSCASCHAQPAIGGSGAAINPQFQFTNGAAPRVAPADDTPFFITANGPTREARFPFFFNADGSANLSAPNGGVEDLFTVTGRADAGLCSLQQPNFDRARAASNIIFRIPTPTFGAGLIENLDDSTLLNNRLTNLNNSFGIAGALNRNGNDGTITRFGWKAQNKSLHIFTGEAYNVEMGISNLLFTQDRPLPEEEQRRGLPASCLNLAGIGYPEDNSNPVATPNAAVLDDVSAFANFMRTLAPPLPGGVILKGNPVTSMSIENGRDLFSAIGCATCHNPRVGVTQMSTTTGSLSTGPGSLSNAPVEAFSDIEIHHMGTGLADNVSQGAAGGDQFRTAPLWGLGQRIFLLHDGRTKDLISAILAHDSSGSEADITIDNFQFNLTPSQRQDVLTFLRSL